MSNTGHSEDYESKKTATEPPMSGELDLPIWSVVSFEKHEAAGLPYDVAFAKLEELEAKGVAGLCVVTDDAAARIGKN